MLVNNINITITPNDQENIFHIDKTCNLLEGKLDLTKFIKSQPLTTRCSYQQNESEEQIKPFILDCLPEGLSGYGHALINTHFSDIQYYRTWICDLAFEIVRLRFYPNKPSRFSCLYACTDDSLAQHISNLDLAGKQFKVFRVELPGKEYWHKGDSKWLDNAFSVANCLYNARYYWAGEQRLDAFSNRPAWEYLITNNVELTHLLTQAELDAVLEAYPF